MKEIANNRKDYLMPETKAVRVAVESSVCASSVNIKAKENTPNVEVDEWDSFENGVTFD